MTVERIDPYKGQSPTYLGKKGVEYAGLDVFDNPGVTIVRMTSDEVTSMCPITGQPDFEVVDVTYAPREKCIESKALKLYLHSLRNTAAFVEALAKQIADDIASACAPHWVSVSVTQKARGGISIVAVSTIWRKTYIDAELPQGSDPGYEVASLPITPPKNLYLER